VRALAERVGALGRLRVLFNTAGVSPVEATPEQIIAVDALGTAYLLDEFLPFVVDGTVGVFIASMAATTTTDLDSETLAEMALTPTAQLGQLSVFKRSIESGMAYGIAKRANQVRVQAASVTWGARGGRVVSVSPGIISSTNGRKELAGSSGEMMRQMIDLAAVGRIGTPEDIAAVVEFLVSQEACHITGIDILVDGGISAAMRYGAQAGESSRSST
jgi:NAD(P)-dependent dehydrogenase (short-subunit alcohol dehydrogenase family)